MPLAQAVDDHGEMTEHGKVPKIVVELCHRIEAKVETEGLYRQAGNKARQNRVKAALNEGHFVSIGDLPSRHVCSVVSPLMATVNPSRARHV